MEASSAVKTQLVGDSLLCGVAMAARRSPLCSGRGGQGPLMAHGAQGTRRIAEAGSPGAIETHKAEAFCVCETAEGSLHLHTGIYSSPVPSACQEHSSVLLPYVGSLPPACL